jgi:hypothetical protein
MTRRAAGATPAERGGSLAHRPRQIAIGEKHAAGVRKRARWIDTGDPHQRAGVCERLHHCRDLVGVRPHENRPRHHRGLEDVVPADGNERASDNGHVRRRVASGQNPISIQHDDVARVA